MTGSPLLSDGQVTGMAMVSMVAGTFSVVAGTAVVGTVNLVAGTVSVVVATWTP